MEPIDFVITWVDANDPKWQHKRNCALGKTVERAEANIGDERFRDYGTLKYLLRSIAVNAPWVHRIYLLTDDQVPIWLNEEKDDRLVVIDHQQIIDKRYLPCFNSNTIELNAVNIPELTERFVIFNDDLLINRPVSPEDFFDGEKPRDFRIYQPLQPRSDYDSILFNNSRLINAWLDNHYQSKAGLIRREYGHQVIKNLYHLYAEPGHKVSSYVLAHNAQAFTKTKFNQALTLWNESIHETFGHQFRSNDDISILLMRDYQLELGYFSPRSPQFSCYYSLADYSHLSEDLKKKQHALLCINDAEVDNYEVAAGDIVAMLEATFPQKSDFER